MFSEPVNESLVEERPGSAGVLRATPGGLGGPSRPPCSQVAWAISQTLKAMKPAMERSDRTT